jgi:RimJ/RimL family protein N-acetyltransferase
MISIKLRKVFKKDWDYVLKLRNFDEYKKNFYNPEIILKSEHYNYLEKQKNNPNFVNWIICNNKKDVGYVRILDNDVSIIIDKEFQNKGIGTMALIAIESEAKKLGLKKLVGRIMISNKSSKKIFTENNYKLKMWWYEKEIQ